MKLMAAAVALLAVGLGGDVNAAPLSVDLAPASGEIQDVDNSAGSRFRLEFDLVGPVPSPAGALDGLVVNYKLPEGRRLEFRPDGLAPTGFFVGFDFRFGGGASGPFIADIPFELTFLGADGVIPTEFSLSQGFRQNGNQLVVTVLSFGVSRFSFSELQLSFDGSIPVGPDPFELEAAVIDSFQSNPVNNDQTLFLVTTAVPLPSSLWLYLGIAGVGFLLRPRKTSAAA